jgi:hypothetical protein
MRVFIMIPSAVWAEDAYSAVKVAPSSVADTHTAAAGQASKDMPVDATPSSMHG